VIDPAAGVDRPVGAGEALGVDRPAPGPQERRLIVVLGGPGAGAEGEVGGLGVEEGTDPGPEGVGVEGVGGGRSGLEMFDLTGKGAVVTGGGRGLGRGIARTLATAGGGSIINLSSRSGSQPCPMTGQYGAAKAGVENLTATMAVERGHLGIRVNAVAPGVIPTEEAWPRGHPEQAQPPDPPGGRRAPAPLGYRRRRRRPVRFLASDEAGRITGEVIQLNGGSRITVGLTYMHHITEQPAAQAAGATAGDGR
jgi:hypothetical protein